VKSHGRGRPHHVPLGPPSPPGVFGGFRLDSALYGLGIPMGIPMNDWVTQWRFSIRHGDVFRELGGVAPPANRLKVHPTYIQYD